MTTPEDQLEVVLNAANIDGDVLDAGSAASLAEALGLDAVTTDDFVRALAQSADWDGEAAPDGEFELRVGTWKLDISKSTTRAAVMAAILSATLVATDTKEMGVALLMAIIPSIVDIENVTLSAGDQKLLIEVRRLPEVCDHMVPIDDLYDRLPEEVRQRLNKYDFADFMERVRNADEAFGNDYRVRVRKANKDIPSISWH